MIYQMSAAVQYGVSIVISPLTSLIHDQMTHLHRLNIEALWFCAESTEFEMNNWCYQLSLRFIKCRVIFITPEKFIASERIRNTLVLLHKRNLLKRIVFDECHCVSEWGQSFRPSYL
jgi:bloom syndrome protein